MPNFSPRWVRTVLVILSLGALVFLSGGCFFDPAFVEQARLQYEKNHNLNNTSPFEETSVDAGSQQASGEQQAPVGSTHAPYGAQACASCHDIQAAYRLKAEGKDLCLGCHGEDGFTGEYVHVPVIAGNCQACHDPHRSDFPHLLTAEGSRVCLSCHDLEGLWERAPFHKDAGDACLDCHQPHRGSDETMMR